MAFHATEAAVKFLEDILPFPVVKVEALSVSSPDIATEVAPLSVSSVVN